MIDSMHGPTAGTGGALSAEQRFDQLYESAGSALLAYALRRCPTREDAYDLTAESFAVVWRRRSELPLSANEARAWLFGVARLTLASTSRAGQRDGRLGRALAQEMRGESVPDPSSLLEAQSEQAQVRAALATLSTDDQELIKLTTWEGLTTAQAGAVLNLTPGAARVRIHRARLRLRALLTPTTSPEEDFRP